MKIRAFVICVIVSAASMSGVAGATDVAKFAAHARVNSVKISPDGHYLALDQIFGNVSTLGLVDLATMKMQNVGAREGAEVVAFDWVSPDRVMYSIGEHNGAIERPSANGELYTVKGDGTGAALVFGYRIGSSMSTASHIKQAEAEMALGTLIAPIVDDSNYALVSSYPLNHTVNSNQANSVTYTDSFSGSFPEVVRLDVRDGKRTRVLTSPLRRAHFIADHRGVVRMVIGRGDDQKTKVLYRANDHADWQPVWDAGKDKQAFVPLQFDRSNENVYVRCGTGSADAICRWEAATSKLTTLWTATDSSTAELVSTFDGMDAFAIRTMPGRSATVLLDKSAPEAKLLVTLMKQFAGEDIRFTSASRDGRKVVFVAEADVDPGVFYLYDADKQKISTLFERRPGIKPEQMAPMEPIAFKARDGLALHGYLTRPRGKEAARNLPTVVFVHGGPYFVRDSWEFDPNVQMLAAGGYAVLQVNFRGSAGYGDDFEHAGYREWGGKMQDDVTDATRWAIAQGVSDPRRICIFGASYGGYAALEGAVKEPDLYRCAIGYVGVYDLRLMHTRGDTTSVSYGVSYLKEVLGEDDADLWNRSPIAHLDALKAKVMLIVGGADSRVPAIQGENMHAALGKHGVEHEWLYERTEGHGFFDEAHVADLYSRILAFLDRNIGAPSASSTAPAK